MIPKRNTLCFYCDSLAKAIETPNPARHTPSTIRPLVTEQENKSIILLLHFSLKLLLHFLHNIGIFVCDIVPFARILF